MIYITDRSLGVLEAIPDAQILSDTATSEAGGAETLELTLTTSAAAAEPGNYILCKFRGVYKAYAILESTEKTVAETVEIYAEGAGLDLINSISGEYAASSVLTFRDYFDLIAAGSGFSLRVDESGGTRKKISWDTDKTAAARILDVAAEFGLELDYCIEVAGMSVKAMYVDAYAVRVRNPLQIPTLTAGKEISEVRITRSAMRLATALKVTGSDGLTLAGSTYDDGDIYYDTALDLLRSRSAYETYCRVWTTGYERRDIVRTLEVQTESAAVLLATAVGDLKGRNKVVPKYDADVNYLPASVRAGDAVRIVNKAGTLRLTARIEKIRTSAKSARQSAELAAIEEET